MIVRSRFVVVAVLSLWLVAVGCNRNTGPVPADEGAAEFFYSGTVTAAKQPPSAGTLFVAAVPESGGPPALVARYDTNRFPVIFTLTSHDQMLASVDMSAKMRMFARFDLDGDVNTKGPWDQEIRTEEAYAAGATGVNLVLQPLAASADAQLSITGTVYGTRETGATLFIFVKAPPMPMPIAAVRVPDPVFPVKFAMSDANVIMKGQPLPASIRLEARLDRDGDGMTKDISEQQYAGPGGPAIRDDAQIIRLVRGQ